MYLSYFGLTEKPFSITPDPRYLYMSDLHREAMAHLTYGVTEGGGFVQLTGEVGTGKTTICRCLLDQLPDKVIVALINNPRVNERQFLAAVCDELGITYPNEYSSKTLIDLLNTYLLDAHASGARVVLIVDEAQNLSRGVLERVRLLTNLETAKKKLLQIILIGQPELVETLKRPDLRQLAQRITARYALDPLSRKDIKAYIQHRLSVAGCTQPLFSAGAVRLVHRYSEGIPRLINVLCDHALLGAYSQGANHVTTGIMKQAAREVFGKHTDSRWLRPTALALASLAAVGVGAWLLVNNTVEQTPVNVASQSEQSSVSATVAVAGLAANPVDADQSEPSSVLQTPATDATAQKSSPPALSPEDARVALMAALERSGDRANLDNGFAGLTRRWGRPGVLNRDETVCDAGFRLGLGCLSLGGGWPELSRLNRIALIGLNANTEDKRYLLVTAMHDANVTIDIGGVESVHPKEAFEPFWDGTFTLLWRPPVTVSVIRPGAPEDEVIWLRQALDYVLREASQEGNNPKFDDALADRVKRVQASLGLEPTGEVESRTLIMLNTLLYAATDGTPTLHAL